MGKLNSFNLYDVRAELGEEEIVVQDTVARFVDDEVISVIGECFDTARFRAEPVLKIAGLAPLGRSIDGCECAGLNSVNYGLNCQELERGDSGIRSFASV